MLKICRESPYTVPYIIINYFMYFLEHFNEIVLLSNTHLYIHPEKYIEQQLSQKFESAKKRRRGFIRISNNYMDDWPLSNP